MAHAGETTELEALWTEMKAEIAESDTVWTPEESKTMMEKMWGSGMAYTPPQSPVESLTLEECRRDLGKMRAVVESLEKVNARYMGMNQFLLSEVQRFDLKKKMLVRMYMEKILTPEEADKAYDAFVEVNKQLQ